MMPPSLFIPFPKRAQQRPRLKTEINEGKQADGIMDTGKNVVYIIQRHKLKPPN